MKKSDNQMQEWDSAYQNKDNFVFYPHEEIIRFVSKFIRKRTGRNEFINVHNAEDIRVFDLILGDDSEHARAFSGEELVVTAHEEGTIKSFFNMEKINNILGVFFELEDCQLIKHQNVLSGRYHARYCLIARRV
jgi:hypothetical protein